MTLKNTEKVQSKHTTKCNLKKKKIKTQTLKNIHACEYCINVTYITELWI